MIDIINANVHFDLSSLLDRPMFEKAGSFYASVPSDSFAYGWAPKRFYTIIYDFPKDTPEIPRDETAVKIT